jgi:hypothetical protein
MKCQQAVGLHINCLTNTMLHWTGLHEYNENVGKTDVSTVSLLLACAQIQVCVHHSLPITAFTATVFTIISGGNVYVMYICMYIIQASVNLILNMGNYINYLVYIFILIHHFNSNKGITQVRHKLNKQMLTTEVNLTYSNSYMENLLYKICSHS